MLPKRTILCRIGQHCLIRQSTSNLPGPGPGNSVQTAYRPTDFDCPSAPSIVGARSSDELQFYMFSIGQLRSIHAIPRDLLLSDTPINQ